MKPGDVVFYGEDPARPMHSAIAVGDGRVVSQGSEAGPHLLNADYRQDLMEVRRYFG